jgi:hypothetical protein
MSDSEPDVKKFLTNIAVTISAVILWMLINSTIGIAFNYAFFDDTPKPENYIFYGWFLISLFFLILYCRRKWK